MLNINVNKGEYIFNVPNSWDDISAEKMILLMSSKTDNLLDILNIVTDIPSEIFIKFDKKLIQKIFDNLKFITDEKGLKEYTPPELEDYFMIDLDEITLGEYLDLDYYISKNKENVYENLIEIVQIVYRKEKKYDYKKIKARKNIFKKKLNGVKAIRILNKILIFRAKLSEKYKELFMEENGDNEQLGGTAYRESWGWLGFVYGLANNFLEVDEILEKNLIAALNWATWIKYNNDQQRLKMKN